MRRGRRVFASYNFSDHRNRDDDHKRWMRKPDLPRIMEQAQTGTLSGVEIMAVGTHNGDKFTERELDEMVSAFSALDFRPAIKLGHVVDETGLPALGYVANLRRIGQKLIGDITDIPAEVYAAIREKRYNRLSAEVLYNFKRAGNSFRRVLRAVALLGVEIPAVAGLKPLVGQYAERGEYERIGFYELETSDMADIDALKAEIEELKAKLAGKNDESTEIVRQQNLSLQEQLAAAQRDAAVAKETADAIKREAIEAKATAKAAEVKVPAFRECIKAMFTLAGSDERTAIYSINGKTEAVTLSKLLDDLVTEINTKSAHLFAAATKAADSDHKVREPEQYQSAGHEVDAKARAFALQHKSDYASAVKSVLAADAELAARYINSPYKQ